MAQQLADKKALTLEVAKKIAAAAEDAAVKGGIRVVIAVVDDGGNLIYLEKMDDTMLSNIDVALAKAHTAVFTRRPSQYYQDALAAGNMSVLRYYAPVIPLGGGVPLMVDGKLIGAIAVSSAPPAKPDDDGRVAAAGVAVLAKIAGQ